MKNTKKFSILILGAAMTVNILTASAASATTTNVFVNNELTAKGFIEEGKSYIPLRSISETLGAIVDWDKETKTITISKKDITIVQRIDSPTARVNNKTVDIGSPALIKENITYVPLRFVSENLGAGVLWDNVKRVVQITAEGVVSKEQALKGKYDKLIAGARTLESFDMEPVTNYTTKDKLPQNRDGNRFDVMGYVTKSNLPIKLGRDEHIFDIGTGILKDGTEVLELTLSTKNRDAATGIVFATKKNGLLITGDMHLDGVREDIVKLDDGTFIVKQKYTLKKLERMGSSIKNVEGIVFYKPVDKTAIMVKTEI